METTSLLVCGNSGQTMHISAQTSSVVPKTQLTFYKLQRTAKVPLLGQKKLNRCLLKSLSVNRNVWRSSAVSSQSSNGTGDHGDPQKVKETLDVNESQISVEENSNMNEPQTSVEDSSDMGAEKKEMKSFNGHAPSFAGSTNPIDPINDGGWSMPVQLDKGPWTAKLPEIAATLCLAVGLAFFGYSNYQKRGASVVQPHDALPTNGNEPRSAMALETEVAQPNSANAQEKSEAQVTEDEKVAEATSEILDSVKLGDNEAVPAPAEFRTPLEQEKQMQEEYEEVNKLEGEEGVKNESLESSESLDEREAENKEDMRVSLVAGSESIIDGAVEKEVDQGAEETKKENKEEEHKGADSNQDDDAQSMDLSTLLPWSQVMGEDHKETVEQIGSFLGVEQQLQQDDEEQNESEKPEDKQDKVQEEAQTEEEEALEEVLRIEELPSIYQRDAASVTGSLSSLSSLGGGVHFLPAPVYQSRAGSGTNSILGKLLIPASVDEAHAAALEALQTLKVVEADVRPSDICSRREFARWLVTASQTLSRNPGDKISPAMYFEGITEYAFDDVKSDDPDFAAIQGLAEAGLIASKLSLADLGCDRTIAASKPGCGAANQEEALFKPDSPLTRQDLISWKLAAEHRTFDLADFNEPKRLLSVFLDVERIDAEALPAIAVDLAAGDKSIMASAFGLTRRFEPHKAVTCAQVACALSLGDSADVVSEELSRMEAEAIAEAAVLAVVEAEDRLAREESMAVNAANEEVTRVQRGKEDALKEAELARQQLREERELRERELEDIRSAKAAAEKERAMLQQLKEELVSQISELGGKTERLKMEQESAEKLRAEAKAEKEVIDALKGEVEVERKALTMARNWAEQQAKSAREEVRELELMKVALQSQRDTSELNNSIPFEKVPALPKWSEESTEGTNDVKESGSFDFQNLNPGNVNLSEVGQQMKVKANDALKQTEQLLKTGAQKCSEVVQEGQSVASQRWDTLRGQSSNALNGLAPKRDFKIKDIADAASRVIENVSRKFKPSG